jgi:hypothetical protein
MPKLTKKMVDKLELPAKGQKFVWDDELKGIGIRLTPGEQIIFCSGQGKWENQAHDHWKAWCIYS